MRAFVIVFETHMVSVVSQWVDCLVLHKWMWLFSHSRRFMEGIDSFNHALTGNPIFIGNISFHKVPQNFSKMLPPL